MGNVGADDRGVGGSAGAVGTVGEPVGNMGRGSTAREAICQIASVTVRPIGTYRLGFGFGEKNESQNKIEIFFCNKIFVMCWSDFWGTVYLIGKCEI